MSLWLGEQFAADLAMMFKGLNVKTISSNKILGLMGQDFPLPQVGHAFSEEQWDIRDAIVLLVSHSGGTFGTLAVSNLLQASSKNIFVVASEWDTQIGKQIRSLPPGVFESRIFSTNIGVRPAEPCTLSVVATHHLLTLILEVPMPATLAIHLIPLDSSVELLRVPQPPRITMTLGIKYPGWIPPRHVVVVGGHYATYHVGLVRHVPTPHEISQITRGD